MEAPVADILTELDRWWPVLGILATLVYGWGVYHLSRRFATRAEHHDTQKTVAELGDRVEELERRMETVPDGKTMHAIQLSLEELRGDIKAIGTRMDGMKTSVSGLENQIAMLVQHHLENSR